MLPHIKIPKKSPIVIYDTIKSEELDEMLGVKYQCLPGRFEIIYISPKLIYIFISRIVSSKKFFDISNFYLQYLLSCLDCMDPKHVVTMSAFDPTFSHLANNSPSRIFSGFQYGVLGYEKLNAVTMDNMFVLGEHDESRIKEAGSKVGKYHRFGTIRGSLFCGRKNRFDRNKYDLCLISQYRKVIFNDAKYRRLAYGLTLLALRLKKYMDVHPEMHVCIALDKDYQQGSYDFYYSIFGNSIEYCFPYGFDSYEAVMTSEVCISSYSTLGFEALGFGKKVLFCNVSKKSIEVFEFYKHPIIGIDQCSRGIFEGRLSLLLDMDLSEYYEATNDCRKYIAPAPIYLSEKQLTGVALLDTLIKSRMVHFSEFLLLIGSFALNVDFSCSGLLTTILQG